MEVIHGDECGGEGGTERGCNFVGAFGPCLCRGVVVVVGGGGWGGAGRGGTGLSRP